MKGKVPYGSPEQLMGTKIDRRSDIFSLGILMYVMLSGLHPFKGDGDQKTMENIVKRNPVPLRDLVPTVPPDVEAIVLRALEKDPANRFPDCAAMQRALDQALSALGAAVTDGDVGAFVKSMVGDLIDDRRAKLASAIQHADNAPAAIPSSDTTSIRRSTGHRGGAPLPATFKGIIPVSLDDTPANEPPRSAKKTPATMFVGAPSSTVVTTPRQRRSLFPYILVGILVCLGGAAFAVRAGHLPWIAAALPPSVRDVILYGGPASSSRDEGAAPPAPPAPPAPVVTAEVPPPDPPPAPTPSAIPSPSPTPSAVDPIDAGPDDAASPAPTPTAIAPQPPRSQPAAPRPNGMQRRSPRPTRPLLESPYE
jgi:serine/threonine-protein kinase